jgi:hypothetical protein
VKPAGGLAGFCIGRKRRLPTGGRDTVVISALMGILVDLFSTWRVAHSCVGRSAALERRWSGEGDETKEQGRWVGSVKGETGSA